MPAVEFTEYVLPNGRRRQVFIDCPDYVAAAAEELHRRGYRFECETLTTGHVSLTIVGPTGPVDEDDEGDVAIEVVPNGPSVLDAVDRLILSFNPDTPQAAEQGNMKP